ncbi:MAG: hypothetical protein IPL65_00190 [Lewinellaceae bacterium]|nr:hypothetical protein [Lewinellaceae bacterium]
MYKILLMITLLCCCAGLLRAQQSPDVLREYLKGRWEVVGYAEAGVQVDKKQPAAPQAVKIWQKVRKERALYWYGYDEDWDNRKPRKYEQWELRDSTLEVQRLIDAISTPYYAVFFADSTLACYNKVNDTGEMLFPEVHFYIFNPETQSIWIYASRLAPRYQQWNAQVIMLNAEQMTLFLPEEGEIVHLVKTPYTIP